MYFNEKHKQMVENRGYIYIGSYDRKEVTLDGKNKKMNKIHIKVECNYCGKKYDVDIYSFRNGVNCTNCCGSYEKSFAYYIQHELGESLNKYWNWKKNTVNPYHIYKNSSKTKVWIKCTKTDYHESTFMTTASFHEGNRCPYCTNNQGKIHPKDSFGQWLIDIYGNDAIEKYWSPKNTLDPFNIAPKSSSTQVWILCQKKDYHNESGGYQLTTDKFTSGRGCPYCSLKGKHIHPKDSFAQWGIDNIDKDFLIKYWSKKNTLDPWKIAPRSTNEIWIYCQEKEYHNDKGGYLTTCDRFYNGNRCSYCASKKIHYKDSFGNLYPEKAKYWSSNNNKTAFEVAPNGGDKYKFICEKCGEEFKRKLSVITKSNTGVVCKDCQGSQLEEKCKTILQKHNITYIREVKFNDLLGLGGKHLSYDFYLPNLNLLLELQGEQHEYFIKGLHRTQRNFERQLVHDERKREYAKQHNIKLLEIWYYDIDNIEEILTKQLNL